MTPHISLVLGTAPERADPRASRRVAGSVVFLALRMPRALGASCWRALRAPRSTPRARLTAPSHDAVYALAVHGGAAVLVAVLGNCARNPAEARCWRLGLSSTARHTRPSANHGGLATTLRPPLHAAPRLPGAPARVARLRCRGYRPQVCGRFPRANAIRANEPYTSPHFFSEHGACTQPRMATEKGPSEHPLLAVLQRAATIARGAAADARAWTLAQVRQRLLDQSRSERPDWISDRSWNSGLACARLAHASRTPRLATPRARLRASRRRAASSRSATPKAPPSWARERVTIKNLQGGWSRAAARRDAAFGGKSRRRDSRAWAEQGHSSKRRSHEVHPNPASTGHGAETTARDVIGARRLDAIMAIVTGATPRRLSGCLICQ